MARTITALAVLLAVAPLSAQEMATGEGMPDGWMVRLDRAGAGLDMVDFQVMEPGWHATTGRAGAGILWRPEMTASGEYTASTRMHLFEPRPHAEAFGLFVGGENLDAADQRYLYFLVRQTGEYLIKRRVGPETENVVGWTRHDAIPTMEPGAGDPTEYDLAVEVGARDVTFRVNGATVHTLPRTELRTDGQVGLRINHMLNIHVESVELDT